jgi:hypothetical protein
MNMLVASRARPGWLRQKGRVVRSTSVTAEMTVTRTTMGAQQQTARRDAALEASRDV